MCKYILKTGNQCKKSPKKDLCHIHSSQQAQEFKDTCLIITLNQKIDILTKISTTQSDLIKNNKKAYDELYDQHIKNIDEHNLLLTFAEKMNQQLTNAKNEIKNLNKTIEKKNNVIADLLREVSNIKKKKQEMEEDFNNYQIIKNFEKKKAELINQNIDIYNVNDQDFHNMRWLRNQLAHPILCKNDRVL